MLWPRAWWFEGLLGAEHSQKRQRGVRCPSPALTHCSGSSRPAPASCPRPPAPSEPPQSHLVAAGWPEGYKIRGPGIWIAQEWSTGGALTPSELWGPLGLTWALQNLFISSSLARRSRVRRHVGYLSMVPEFLTKVSSTCGGSDQSATWPGLLVDRGWGSFVWKGPKKTWAGSGASSDRRDGGLET